MRRFEVLAVARSHPCEPQSASRKHRQPHWSPPSSAEGTWHDARARATMPTRRGVTFAIDKQQEGGANLDGDAERHSDATAIAPCSWQHDSNRPAGRSVSAQEQRGRVFRCRARPSRCVLLVSAPYAFRRTEAETRRQARRRHSRCPQATPSCDETAELGSTCSAGELGRRIGDGAVAPTRLLAARGVAGVSLYGAGRRPRKD